MNALCGSLIFFIDPPMRYLMHARGFCMLGIWKVQYSCIQWFLQGYIRSLFSTAMVISLIRQSIVCCKPLSTNLSIILKELLGFSSSVFGGFSLGISCILWLIDLYGWFMEFIYVAGLLMRFICDWYKDSYVADLWNS